ncbi:MAG: hypothetical protein ACTMIV_10850 [Brevibacterium aurantiacum]
MVPKKASQPEEWVTAVVKAQKKFESAANRYEKAGQERVEIFNAAIREGGMSAYGISKALDNNPTANRVARLVAADRKG